MTIMSNMISELRGAHHELTDEQQVQAVIHSLPSAWEHLCINLTHNDNIKTFDDVARHVELEEDRFLADKPYGEAYMTESKKIGASGSRRNKWKGKVIKQRKREDKANYNGNQRKHGRHAGNKSKNMNCFNCGKPGHFAHDYTESKVLYDQTRYSNAYVSSCLMLAKTVPYWIVDSTATDHIARDQNAFVDFRRISKGSRTIYSKRAWNWHLQIGDVEGSHSLSP